MGTPLWLKVSSLGVFTLAMGWAYIDEKNKRMIMDNPCVKQSIKLLENYPQVDKYLGKPLYIKPLNLGHPFNEFKEDSTKFALSVRGQNHNAELFSWCSKVPEETDEAKSWQVDRLDLGIDKVQRMTFYKRPGAAED